MRSQYPIEIRFSERAGRAWPAAAAGSCGRGRRAGPGPPTTRASSQNSSGVSQTFSTRRRRKRPRRPVYGRPSRYRVSYSYTTKTIYVIKDSFLIFQKEAPTLEMYFKVHSHHLPIRTIRTEFFISCTVLTASDKSTVHFQIFFWCYNYNMQSIICRLF